MSAGKTKFTLICVRTWTAPTKFKINPSYVDTPSTPRFHTPHPLFPEPRNTTETSAVFLASRNAQTKIVDEVSPALARQRAAAQRKVAPRRSTKKTEGVFTPPQVTIIGRALKCSRPLPLYQTIMMTLCSGSRSQPWFCLLKK